MPCDWSARCSVAGGLLLVTATAAGAVGSHIVQSGFVCRRDARSHFNLSLRGGNPVVLFSGGDDEEQIGSTRHNVKQVANPMLDPPVPAGTMTATEADRLRKQGTIHGPWNIESQEEPESDVQDAHPNEWPEEWGGEEEWETLPGAPGPVRLYSTTKYNHDVLPTGRIKEETMERVGASLGDDNAFTEVVIHDGDPSPPPSGPGGPAVAAAAPWWGRSRQGAGDSAPDSDGEVQQTLSGLWDHSGAAAAPSGLTGGESVVPGVSKAQADEWLKEAEAPWMSKADRAKVPLQPPGEGMRMNLDAAGGKPRSQARIAAEARLDRAIEANDAAAVEAAVAALQAVDDAESLKM